MQRNESTDARSPLIGSDLNLQNSPDNLNQIEDELLTEEKVNKDPISKTDPLRLSIRTKEREDQLEAIRHLDWFHRIFRPLEKGSLRGVVILWIRMTLGVGVLTLPYYMSIYGYVYGIIAILAAGLLNLNSFFNIFAVSTALKETNYLNLIDKTLGRFVHNMFRITFFLDMSSTFVIIVIVCWNLFEYSLYFLGLTQPDWFTNVDKMQFNENHPALVKIRGAFLIVLFVLSVPFFLRKTLQAIQKLAIILLFLILTLIFFIIFQTPYFYQANADSPKLPTKQFSPIWIECFFSILLSYYVQPFIFSLRSELLTPSLKRMNKVAKLTISFEMILFCLVALAGYFSLGEKYMTNLYLLRKAYKGENTIVETVYRGLIGLYFLFASLGIAVFNPAMRDYLYQTLKLGNGKKTFIIASLLPFAIYCSIAFVKPNIIDVFNWTGLTICNFNGYIVPALMRICVIKARGGSRVKMVFEILQVILLIGLCGLGVYFKFAKSPQ